MASILPVSQSNVDYRIVSFITLDGQYYTYTAGLCKLGLPEVYSAFPDTRMGQLLVGEIAHLVRSQLPALGIQHTSELKNQDDIPVRLSVQALSSDQVRYIQPVLCLAALQAVGVEMVDVLKYGIYQVVSPDERNVLPGERGYSGHKYTPIQTELLH